jgi:outer membrane protein TolC
VLRPAALAAVLTLLAATSASAQGPLSLAEALATADRGAWANRIARGTAAADRARTLAPTKGILPTARIEAGFVRTTDPIGAFGTTLRQRAVTPAAFDPQRLNFPDAVNNWQSALVLEAPLFNGDAWAGRAAATRAADASDAGAEWTRTSTRADVVKAYYGGVLAAEKVATLEAATRAARASVEQVRSMVREGLVTKADLLLAEVRAGELEADLAEARAGAASARQQLALALGRAAAEAPLLPDALPSGSHLRRVVADDTLPHDAFVAARRADVGAARRGLDAASADAWRARATLLPRLNAFARYDWNSPSTLYDGRNNWTVGVMASWALFNGAADVADVQGTRARAAAARAGAEAAAAKAELEADVSRTALVVALQRLAIAEQGALQSAEAHRLVQRRYEGGLATIAELLGAQATRTGSALALSAARYGVIAAAAARRQAIGADPGSLVALEQTAGVAAAGDQPDATATDDARDVTSPPTPPSATPNPSSR